MNRYPTRTWQSSTPRAAVAEPLWARLVLPALVLVTATLLLLDLAAVLSTLLSAHGVPALRGGWVGGPLRILMNPADPDAAWTSPEAAPPAWLFWTCVCLLLAASLYGGLRLLSWHSHRREEASRQAPLRKRRGFLSPGEANSAFGERATRTAAARLHPSLTPHELARRPASELAIPLGRCGPFSVFASEEHTTAVLGGTRHGKTAGPLARVALTHRGPLVFTTTKPDDLKFTFAPPEGERGGQPEIVLFNPDGLSGLPTAAFDPTLGCEDPDRARLSAEAILARQRARGRDRGLDWALLAEKLLKYLLHAAALEHLGVAEPKDAEGRVGMARVVQWAASEKVTQPATVLMKSPQAAHWAQLLQEMAHSAPETFYSIKINLHEALVPWEDPGLLHRMDIARRAPISPERLVRNGDRLLVIARPGGHSLPLVTALVSQVVEAGRQEARQALMAGGRVDPPLLLLLDEVAKVCPLPQLPELVTDCASQGVVLVYCLQDLEDGELAWGTTRFRGMWSATNCHVVMGGISSARTARDLSELSPTVRIEEPREAMNHRGERLDPVLHFEKAVTPDEIKTIDPHTAVCFYGRRPMFLTIPHAENETSEVREQTLRSKAAWERWVAQHQARGEKGDPTP